MKKSFFSAIILALTFTSTLISQNIQSPSEFLGYELGSRFSEHHRVVDYFQYVSSELGNVQLEKYGETNEHRPLYISIISSQKNIDNIEQIRTDNLKRTGLLEGTASDSKTAIVWLSYNVHGNEASSTEAAMITLYELVTKKQEWLKNTIVIMDPCINPDGRDRYIHWYNETKNTPYNVSQDAREHHEPWPSGRPNHYLFDLNRDWAWATQVETQTRLKVYNKWMPHVHVDFHEQGINSPYYFAPAAEPFHEIITDWQKDFQTQIGKNHAKYFDKEGWLYFTRETFDLLYPSYGDTYPTFMGAIGMTYEQAGHGRAGLAIKTDEGEILSLKDRLTHHKTTGLSTVEIASKNAEKLATEFEKFFQNDNLEYKSYVLKNSNKDNINKLKALLDQHDISYGYASASKAKGFHYKTQKEGDLNLTSEDLVVNTNQPKGKMIKALFEPNTKLTDSLTYDITAWAIPYAYGLDAIASKTLVEATDSNNSETITNTVSKNTYAYVSEWNSLDDAVFLSQLLKENIKVRFTNKPFTTQGKSYKPGTLIILRNDNRKSTSFDETLVKIANEQQRELTAVASGFVTSGVDFGSNSVKLINKQNVAVLSGEGTSSLSFGEIWHFFEQQLDYPITVLGTDYFSRVDLSKYDVLILPNGSYSKVLNESTRKKVNDWVKNGGTIIAIGSAVKSFADKKGYDLKAKKAVKDTVSPNLKPYNLQERNYIDKLITGSIFKATIDNTHPLAFGYGKAYFSLKLSGSSYPYLKSGVNVGYYTKDIKPVSGFAGQDALKNVPESLLFGEDTLGKGSIIYMVDNPLFRSFWENGKLFFANAIFLTNSDKLRY